jgi:hypothetical protein
MGFLHSPTPIRRYAMAKGSFSCLRVNSLSPPSRSNDPLDSVGLHDDSVRRSSSFMKRSPLRHLQSAFDLTGKVLNLQQIQGAIFPSFIARRLPEFLEHVPCTLRPLLLSHEAPSGRSPLENCYYFSQTSTCTHLHGSTNSKPTLGNVRTKVQLLSPLDALYAEVFNCTQCRNLLA